MNKGIVMTETKSGADQGSTPAPMTDAERGRARRKRIADAGLVQRKVVGHPDDFEKIHAFAKCLYEERGLEIIVEDGKGDV
jgi:hypothetical protein